ncbi:colicin transporter, partial [Pseudomonas putida]
PKPGKNPQGGGFRIPPTRAGGMGSGITNTEGLRRETRDNIKATENAVKAAYTVNSANSGVAIEADLANLRAQFPAAVSTTAQAYQHELNIRNILTQQKTTQLHTQTSLADSFYGLSPLNSTIGDYLARAQALDGAVTPYGPAYSKWVASFKAGYSAKLLTEHIQLLNSQQVHVQNLLAGAQAEERRVAAEQQAQRVAAEQSRIRAEAEALAHAQEQVRLAALAEAERVAAEQARLAAEAAARYIAAEQARLEAEAEVQRQAEQLRLENQRKAEEQALRDAMAALDAAKGSRPFLVSGAAAASGPVFTVAAGTLAVDAVTNLAIRTALRSAAATAISALAAAVGTASGVMIVVGVAALVYYALRDNKEPYALSLPLSDLTTYDAGALNAIAQANGDIELPVAIGSRSVDNTTEFSVAATNGTSVSRKVPVRFATYDPALNVYRSESATAQSPGMTWTPIVSPGDASTALPAAQPDVAPYTGATATALEGRIDENPELDLYSFGGFIYVFPVESGIPPQFVVFRDRRSEPGVTSGAGQLVSGNWMGTASMPEGAPIPAQIADKLRGRRFSTFNNFRSEFWKAVSNDELLNGQFTKLRQMDMKQGLAPAAFPQDQVGKRIKYEVHHIIPIAQGGEVYDMDNLQIMTPKSHIQTHTKAKGVKE